MHLTHWGWVTHICVSRLTITGSDNVLSPGWYQAIIWTNAGILLIGPLGTNFSKNLIEILTFSFTKIRVKVSSVKWRPFCLGLNVLMACHWLHAKSSSEQLLPYCQLNSWEQTTLKMSRKIYLLFMPKCVTSTHQWIWWFQVTIHMRPHIIMI